MLGSINNRGKVTEPCLLYPIITLHLVTLSIPPPAPKGGATKRQLHSMECYSSSQPSDNCRFSASSFFWAAKVFFRTYVFVNETLSPLKTINGLMNQLYSFGPLAMISLCTSSANPMDMDLCDMYWVN